MRRAPDRCKPLSTAAPTIAAAPRESGEGVAAAAIATHLVGSTGLIAGNAARVLTQPSVAASTLAKAILTGAALATTAYARSLGTTIELVSIGLPQDAEDAAGHPYDIVRAERNLSYAQWLVPAFTGALLAVSTCHRDHHQYTSCPSLPGKAPVGTSRC